MPAISQAMLNLDDLSQKALKWLMKGYKGNCWDGKLPMKELWEAVEKSREQGNDRPVALILQRGAPLAPPPEAPALPMCGWGAPGDWTGYVTSQERAREAFRHGLRKKAERLFRVPEMVGSYWFVLVDSYGTTWVYEGKTNISSSPADMFI